ncbi:hypothetical protein RJF_1730 [Candidozyma auris]|uniref:Uncharacterized protein n=1 Tax=Candidozyma auris TaxID=498019 RepID=A0A0L0NTX5_CANAR|nr:hypothetical protein QG37_06315 [[Candida] auris]
MAQIRFHGEKVAFITTPLVDISSQLYGKSVYYRPKLYFDIDLGTFDNAKRLFWR